MKDNRKLRDKIVQSIQLLFSLDLYKDILDENERQEEEIAQAVSQTIDDLKQTAQDALRQSGWQFIVFTIVLAGIAAFFLDRRRA